MPRCLTNTLMMALNALDMKTSFWIVYFKLLLIAMLMMLLELSAQVNNFSNVSSRIFDLSFATRFSITISVEDHDQNNG